MFYPYNDSSIRFEGRWHFDSEYAATVNSGANFQIAFSGNMIMLNFETENNQPPYPHMWMRLDGGAYFEVPIDVYLRVMAENDGDHLLEVVVKSQNENQSRWKAPRAAATCFRGYVAEKSGILPPKRKRPVVEFVGDSITEGVLIDTYEGLYDKNVERVNQDDVLADYCWLTAKALDVEPVIMGFGAVGMCVSGMGGVPRVSESYPYCFEGVPFNCDPDYVICNHGTNDRPYSKEDFVSRYVEFLDMVRGMHPRAQIIVLTPFCGFWDDALKEMVDNYNRDKNCNVDLILTGGWISPEPVHPWRDGHREVAKRLTEELKKRYDF